MRTHRQDFPKMRDPLAKLSHQTRIQRIKSYTLWYNARETHLHHKQYYIRYERTNVANRCQYGADRCSCHDCTHHKTIHYDANTNYKKYDPNDDWIRSWKKWTILKHKGEHGCYDNNTDQAH